MTIMITSHFKICNLFPKTMEKINKEVNKNKALTKKANKISLNNKFKKQF